MQLTIKQSETLIATTQRTIDKKTGKSIPPELPTTYWYPDGRDIRSVQPDRTVRSTKTTWEGETLVTRTVTIQNGQAIETYTSRWSAEQGRDARELLDDREAQVATGERPHDPETKVESGDSQGRGLSRNHCPYRRRGLYGVVARNRTGV
jgi:hypothetical protein